jgi:Leucine-rich repeat (LRR) protein
MRQLDKSMFRSWQILHEIRAASQNNNRFLSFFYQHYKALGELEVILPMVESGCKNIYTVIYNYSTLEDIVQYEEISDLMITEINLCTMYYYHPQSKNFNLLLMLRHLKNITALTIKDCYAYKLIEPYLAQFEQLETIDISRCKIEVFPENIVDLPNLKKLYIEENKLSYLPDSMQSMQNLEHISFSKNSFDHIPNILQTLKKLAYIDFSSCPITAFPQWFGKMAQLIEIRLSFCKIQHIIPDVFCLPNLCSIYINDNELTAIDLPANTNAPCLSHFYISNNSLTHFPTNLHLLPSLWDLDMENCTITEIPAEIGLMSQLCHLTLSNNKITNLPENFGNLINLENLSIDGNPLVRLPSTLKNLPEFEFLSISGNAKEDNDKLKAVLPPQCQINYCSVLPKTITVKLPK